MALFYADGERSMQLACPSCTKTLEFSGERPRFCGFCGQALGTPAPGDMEISESATATPETVPLPGDKTAPPPNEADTVAASSPALGALGPNVPETVGGYRLLRRLGGGGMGAVYEAEEPSSGRRVALKLVLPEYAGSSETLTRFRQEGRLASSLAHPRCVFVLAADEEAGRPYIVMELMPGATLDDLVRERGPLSTEEAVGKILDVIEGLEEAHRLGLVHRDVKPSNCFLEANGRVKIGDFGLARSLVGDSKLTRTGAFVGTPLYAAPEQIHKKEATDAQSDVYSVAATLYFLLTGRAPFQTGDSMATLARIITEDAPPMRSVRPGLSKALDKVVLRGLERDRRRRWKNVEEFRRALAPFLPARPSAVGLGLRFGAYLIDSMLIGTVGTAASLAIGLMGPYPNRATPIVIGYAVGIMLNLGYFGTLEGLLGWSLGKRLLRVRVGTARGTQPPGLGRALLRTGALFFVLNLGTYASYGMLEVLGSMPEQGAFMTTVQTVILLFGVMFPAAWLILAVALTVCTMRARNGYRALHEFVSGTRTYQLNWPRPRPHRAVHGSQVELEVTQPAELPERLGAFQVQGALDWGETSRTLLAEDPTLGRTVWIWMRPASLPSLAAHQRDISRGTRPRWVACGIDEDWQWDAFLAPQGTPLAVLTAGKARLSWAEVRPILEDLAEEMGAACGDGTLPDSLGVDQVWVQSDGRVQILTAPLLKPEIPVVSAVVGGAADYVDEQTRALGFLREVAITALEGAARPCARARDAIHAPLPGYAMHVLDGLFEGRSRCWDVEGFRQELESVRDQPAEVTRLRRFVHLAVTLVLLNLPLWAPCMLVGVPFAILWETAQAPERARDVGEFVGVGIFVGACWAVWIVWAFAFRGGIAYWRGGITLRRADGRKASRLQCAFRAFLVWTPIVCLQALALTAAWLLPSLPELYFGIWGLGAVLLPLYVVLALLKPQRLLHDRIAGTYPVPS